MAWVRLESETRMTDEQQYSVHTHTPTQSPKTQQKLAVRMNPPTLAWRSTSSVLTEGRLRAALLPTQTGIPSLWFTFSNVQGLKAVAKAHPTALAWPLPGWQAVQAALGTARRLQPSTLRLAGRYPVCLSASPSRPISGLRKDGPDRARIALGTDWEGWPIGRDCCGRWTGAASGSRRSSQGDVSESTD